MTTELIDLLESKADDGDKPEQHTGAMIALRPRQDHIDRLALDKGEPPQELHTTILFLGKAADYTYDTRARIIEAMRQVALRFRFVTAKGFGVNFWNADTDEPCIVLAVSGSELVDIRNAIVESMMGFDLLQMPEQHEPWVPHVTLAYTDDGSQVPELAEDLSGEIVYDAIRIAFGGIVDDIPLQPAAASNDGITSNRYAQVISTVGKQFRTPHVTTTGVQIKAINQDKEHCKFCGAKATRIVTGSNEKSLYTCTKHTDNAREWFDANTDSDYETVEEKANLGTCRYCKAKATRKVGIDGGGWIVACDDEDHQSQALIDAKGEGVEKKAVRHVRTAAGVRRFGQPLGSVIVGDGKNPLKNLKEVESEYDGFNKYKARGKTYYTHKNGDHFEAVDQDDRVIASNASEEDLLKDLDSGKLSTSRGHVTVPAKSDDKLPAQGSYSNFKRVDSEYEGYVQYSTPGGDVWRDPKTNTFYDANDNVLSDVQLRRMNTPELNKGKSKPAKDDDSPGNGMKKVESEYPGYSAFRTADGKTTIYRDDANNTWYDENDNEVDINDYNGEKVKADPTGGKKKSTTAPKARSEPEKDTGGAGDMQKAPEKRPERTVKPSGGAVRRSGKGDAPETRTAGSDGTITPARGNQPGKDAEETRSGLYADRLNGADDVNSVLDKVSSSKGPVSARIIEELREVAARQSDVRNRRKLMLYAQQLAEQKAFDSLVEMDPMLRALVLEVKLITPGGRVGSGASLQRSPKKNWIERTKFGRLPKYIRIVANGLKKNGHDTSRAIALAVAAMKRWARGGDHVRPQVQAAAAKALAEWEALKAAA